MSIQMILRADDIGYSEAVNYGIEKTVKEGLVRTGYEMDILTKYLFSDGEFTDCNDCTDYVPSLKHGDLVSVVETTSRGYLIKTNGLSGWYFGELE